jgi:hypothetical protein
VSTGLSLGLRSPGPRNLMSMGASHNDRWASKGNSTTLASSYLTLIGRRLAYVYFENEPGRRREGSQRTLLSCPSYWGSRVSADPKGDGTCVRAAELSSSRTD